MGLISLSEKYAREQPKDADIEGARSLRRSIRKSSILFEPKPGDDDQDDIASQKSGLSDTNNSKFASKGLMGNLPAHFYQDASLFTNAADADLDKAPVDDIREYEFFGEELSVLDDKVDKHFEECAEENEKAEKEKRRKAGERHEARGSGGNDRRSRLMSGKGSGGGSSGSSAKERASNMGRRGSVLSKNLMKQQSIYEKTQDNLQELDENSSLNENSLGGRRYSRRSSNSISSFEHEMEILSAAQKAFDKMKLAICKQGNLSVTNDFEIEAANKSKVTDAKNFGKVRYTVFAVPDSRQKVKVDIIEMDRNKYFIEKIMVRGGK